MRMHWIILSVSSRIYPVEVGIQQETCQSPKTGNTLMISKTELPKAMNMCYSFQPLMGFCSHICLSSPTYRDPLSSFLFQRLCCLLLTKFNQQDRNTKLLSGLWREPQKSILQSIFYSIFFFLFTYKSVKMCGLNMFLLSHSQLPYGESLIRGLYPHFFRSKVSLKVHFFELLSTMPDLPILTNKLFYS